MKKQWKTMSNGGKMRRKNNENSEIRYDGNYFSFIGKYPKDKNQLPYIKVLVPQSKHVTVLSFDKTY